MLELFLKGGPLMWPIAAASVIALAVALHKWFVLRSAYRQLATHTTNEEGRPNLFTPLFKALEKDSSDEEITMIGNNLIRQLQRGLGVLSLVAVLTPLLGLTGTVTGMIQAFQIIAVQTGRVDASILAGGIWQALLTTAAGLLVAIPTHVAFHVLDSRMNDLTAALKEKTVFLRKRKADGF